MKKGILMLAAIVAIGFTSCKNKASDKVKDENMAQSANQDAKKGQFPKMDFEESSFDFGTINEGDVVKHAFKFTNTGDAPLKISDAVGSCGCTVPTPPKDPIAAGDSGEIMVRFNSTGKHESQLKSVRLTTNTKNGTEMLKIKAFVTPKDKAAAVKK